MKKVYFIEGPQGAGKGTQAKVFAKKQGVFYFEAGSVLREIASQDTTLGEKIRGVISRGDLVDDDTILEVTKNKLTVAALEQGIVFDGYPRSLAQAKLCFEFLRSYGFVDFNVIFINVPFEVSVDRLIKRAQIEDRQDDTPEVIAHRLELYQKVTQPMINWMQDECKFFNIDGTQSIEDVTRAIDEAVSHQPNNALTLGQ